MSDDTARLIVLALFGSALTFGIWHQNFWAGAFMFCTQLCFAIIFTEKS